MALAVRAASFATACGGASGSTGLLEGKVTLCPIAPVEQPGDGPNSRPYAATIVGETPEGDVVATVESGDDGRFVRLAAGGCRLVPPRARRGRTLRS